jgi:hypothetical protein
MAKVAFKANGKWVRFTAKAGKAKAKKRACSRRGKTRIAFTTSDGRRISFCGRK